LTILPLVSRERCVTAPIFANHEVKRLEQFVLGKSPRFPACSGFAIGNPQF
jgi:hypothetical protein